MDPLHNRRLLAMIAAIHGLFIFPYAIVALHVGEPLAGQLLTYMAGVIAAPIGGYLYAAHRKDCRDVNTP